ncbi:hypothetical protein [Maribacter aquivivus]|uniref:hypothetical protein n=1 Tax=Maribacter aquivivus TaxID=228958 RepID=UPI000935301A|nr:hypothetical protein [Maribacter aquivivus]
MKNIQIKHAYKSKNELYNQGPSTLREYVIIYLASPIRALLHLLSTEEYIPDIQPKGEGVEN